MRLLSEYTFSNFLNTCQVQSFIQENAEHGEMPYIRYTYLFFIFKKINQFIGDSRVLSCFPKELTEKAQPSLGEVFEACRGMNESSRWELCLVLESLTKGQDNNTLWNVMRDGIISSSKLYRALKVAHSTQNLFQPCPINNDYYVAGPLAFGIRCEGVVKNIISDLIYPGKSCAKDLGFMQSPCDAIFGVSLDMCMNVQEDNIFTTESEIVEIKCRYKYLFTKAEYDKLYPLYSALYLTPNKQNLIKFINGISRPAVEYVSTGRLPSENDYLLTTDREWNVSPKRKRKLNELHSIIGECLRKNAINESRVYLLTDPSETGGLIDIKSEFSVDLFINPKHAYFSQVLLQNKVVSDYVKISGLDSKPKIKNFVASGFFRRRDSEDPLLCFIGGKTQLNQDSEIPIAVIITPLNIPEGATEQNLQRAVDYWSRCSRDAFAYAPWVPRHRRRAV